MPSIIKLNLKQNALYTLFHGIEHLALVDSYQNEEDDELKFDDDDHHWKKRKGSSIIFWLDEYYQHPPNRYNAKYAIQHFIQSLELIFLARLQEHNDEFIYSNRRNKLTIDFNSALNKLVELEKDLFNEEQIDFIKKSKQLRNKVEHFEIAIKKDQLLNLLRQVFFIISYLCIRFWKIDIIEYFSYNPVEDTEYEISSAIHLLQYTDIKNASADKFLEEWQRQHPDDKLVPSLCCNEKSYSMTHKMCIICHDDFWSQFEDLM